MSRQFDVHSTVLSDDADGPPFVVNLQSDHLDLLRTFVAAPLWPAAVRGSAPPASARIRFENRDRVIRAIDLLFNGV
jgi:hypothetical protein